MHHDPTPASATTSETTSATAREAAVGLPVIYCPECGMPAWVEWRDVLGSTAGAVVHLKVRCFARHWFLMTEDRLTQG
jgi:hypothetical protein